MCETCIRCQITREKKTRHSEFPHATSKRRFEDNCLKQYQPESQYGRQLISSKYRNCVYKMNVARIVVVSIQ